MNDANALAVCGLLILPLIFMAAMVFSKPDDRPEQSQEDWTEPMKTTDDNDTY